LVTKYLCYFSLLFLYLVICLVAVIYETRFIFIFLKKKKKKKELLKWCLVNSTLGGSKMQFSQISSMSPFCHSF
jgi:hypothetical protein